MRISAGLRVACLLVATVGVAAADSPSLPVRDHAACSSNGRHCAFVSAAGMVTVFRVEAKVIEPSYAIPGYLEALYVSDDGRTVIAVETLIIRGHERDQPAVRVWSGGRLTQTLFMKDLLGWRWPSKTVTGSAWGHPLGFKGDHQFDLQLAIGGKYEVKF